MPYITNSDGTCRKCGESGLFTQKMRSDHLNASPDCKKHFYGSSSSSCSESLELISAKELCQKELPPLVWLIANLIPSKGVVFLGGKRGSMKTWVALELAKAISEGGKLFGHFQASKLDVIFLDSENGETQIQRRLRMLFGGAALPDNIHFCFFPKIRLDEDASELEEILDEHPNAVVIVDSFRRVLGVDENDARAVNDVFVQKIRPLIEGYGATFILLHHLRKGMGRGVSDHLDEMRGSSELVNYADAVLLIERPRSDSKSIIMRHAKSRTGLEHAPCKIETQSDDEHFQFSFVGSFEDAINQPEKAGEAVLKWAYEKSKVEFQTGEVTAALGADFNPKSISRGLKWLTEKGQIYKAKKGSYRIISKVLTDFGQTDTSIKLVSSVPNEQSQDNTNGQNGQTTSCKEPISIPYEDSSLSFSSDKRDKLNRDSLVSQAR